MPHKNELSALTKAQKSFLESYIPELDQNDFMMDRESFIAKHSGCDFDGHSNASDNRVARNLEIMGYLKGVDAHGKSNLYVEFTPFGLFIIVIVTKRSSGNYITQERIHLNDFLFWRQLFDLGLILRRGRLR